MGDKSIDFQLSGGGSNTDPNLSLGGVLSTTEISGNNLTWDVSAISGITLLDSLGGDGSAIGTLYFIFATTELGIEKTGGLTKDVNFYQDISVDGDYIVESPEGGLNIAVSIVAASLPVADELQVISAAKINPNLFDQILEPEANSGSTKYRHIYLVNNTAASITFGLYLEKNYSTQTTLSMALSTVDPSESIPDELTEPTQIGVFSTPTNIEEATSITLAAGAKKGVFFRRVVAPLSDIGSVQDTAQLVVELI